MGRQVNFYIGPNDLDILDKILQESGPHLIYCRNEECRQVLRSSLKEVIQEWYGSQQYIFLDEGKAPVPDEVTDLGYEFF